MILGGSGLLYSKLEKKNIGYGVNWGGVTVYYMKSGDGKVGSTEG